MGAGAIRAPCRGWLNRKLKGPQWTEEDCRNAWRDCEQAEGVLQ
jgi:hypothetical protein